MWSATSAMNTTVATPVTMVIRVCIRMIRSKPITPPKMVSATTMISAMTLVPLPPPQPSWWNTVAVASVARMTSTVSQPTVSSQEITVGSLLPLTPNAARLSTIVGAEPTAIEAVRRAKLFVFLHLYCHELFDQGFKAELAAAYADRRRASSGAARQPAVAMALHALPESAI